MEREKTFVNMFLSDFLFSQKITEKRELNNLSLCIFSIYTIFYDKGSVKSSLFLRFMLKKCKAKLFFHKNWKVL